MNPEIMAIDPPNPPYDLDAKIFRDCDEEGNIIGEPFSFNDLVKKLEVISGVNEELLGEK